MGKSKNRKDHSGSNEYEWKTSNAPPPSSSKSDDHAAFDDLISRVTSSKSSKTAPTKDSEPTVTAVELNPYWKDQGTGLPSMETESTKQTINSTNHRWYLRAFQHAEEEARGTDESIRDILLQRWSISIVDEMESRFFKPHHKQQHQRVYSNFKRPNSNNSVHEPRELAHEERPYVDESGKNEPGRSLVKEVEERFVTDDDINKMAAQLLKSEFAGNHDKASKLKKKLEILREAKRKNLKVRLSKMVCVSSVAAASSHQNVVHLTTTDAKGREIPLHLQESHDRPSASKYLKLESHDANGNRVNYLQEDSRKSSIDDLLRSERLESAKSSDMQFASMAGRCKYGAEDEYADAFVKPKSKNVEFMRPKQMADAVAEYKRKEYAESKCFVCMERVSRFLVMSVGQRMFLSLPEHVSLTRGHCFLAPLEHTGALTRVDEVAADEIRAYKRALCQMASADPGGAGWLGRTGDSVGPTSYVFMEVAAYPNSHKHHAQIECIPVDRGTMEELPSYFKKALLDLGSEWDQNKRIVTLKQPGAGAQGAIPPNFGYFAVEFGIDGGGYAKVIEDWTSFPSHFGREVLASLLGKSTDKWRKPKRDSPENLRQKAVEFAEHWSPPEGSIIDVAAAKDSSQPEGPDLPPP